MLRSKIAAAVLAAAMSLSAVPESFARGGFGGQGGATSSTSSAISSWVESHFTAQTVGGVTLYDLTQRRAGDGHPVVYYYCELPGGHSGTHSVLPHAIRFIHAPTKGIEPG